MYRGIDMYGYRMLMEVGYRSFNGYVLYQIIICLSQTTTQSHVHVCKGRGKFVLFNDASRAH